MSLYKKFATDENAEAGEGIVLDYGDGVKIRIHRAGGGNKAFARILEAKTKPYRRQIDNGTIDQDVMRRLMAEIYAKSVIIGWEGVTDEDDHPLAFTEENVVKVLLDLPDLFRDIQEAASNAALFRADANAAVEGNSSTPSGGASGGASKKAGSEASQSAESR
jgi:hypothetical protein